MSFLKKSKEQPAPIPATQVEAPKPKVTFDHDESWRMRFPEGVSAALLAQALLDAPFQLAQTEVDNVHVRQNPFVLGSVTTITFRRIAK